MILPAQLSLIISTIICLLAKNKEIQMSERHDSLREGQCQAGFSDLTGFLWFCGFMSDH